MMLFRNVFTLSFWTNFSLICAILPCPIVWSINDYYYYYWIEKLRKGERERRKGMGKEGRGWGKGRGEGDGVRRGGAEGGGGPKKKINKKNFRPKFFFNQNFF